jgi:DNA processing protein
VTRRRSKEAVARANRRLEQAALLALTEASRLPWHEIADVVEQAGSALAVVAGERCWTDPHQLGTGRQPVTGLPPPAEVERWRQTLDDVLSPVDPEPPDATPTTPATPATATSLVTVLDDGYPENLRKVYNRPPFLFVRGTMLASDARAAAVVGTRRASPAGRRYAAMLASLLAREEVTVVSGLAAGIDTEAHLAALEAGGRTLAVMGTGIDRVYPAENRELATRISRAGALISQFWPGAAPRAMNFPLRNVVTSGIAIGTVVVEAGPTSGARMQARIALEHGKRLFLPRDLVEREPWARAYAARPGTTVLRSVEDVGAILAALDAEREAVVELQLF